MTFSHIKNGFSKKLPGSAPDAAFAPKAARVSERPAFARIVLFALLVLPFLFASCSNLFDDISSAIDNHNSSDGMNNLQHGEVVITGGIAVDSSKISGAVPAEMAYFGDIGTTATGRFAVPSLDTTNAEYTVKATADGYSGTRSGEVNSTNKTFSISLVLGYQWTITLEMKTRNADDSVTTKLKGTYTYSSTLSSSNVTTPVNIVLAPIVTSNGTGSIDLQVGTLGYELDVVVNREPQDGAWNAASREIGTTGSNSYRINVTGLKSGVYDITVVIKSGNVIFYTSDQVINVFDNMTTNTWIGDDEGPISGHTFSVNEQLLNNYKRTNYYVDAKDGSDQNGDGSSEAPFATIQQAISTIGSSNLGSEKDCVIRLLTDISENFNLGTSSDALGYGFAKSVTIKGYGGNKIINKGSNETDVSSNGIVYVHTQFPVVLENLTINGNESTKRGIYSVQDTYSLKLKNCTITKCYISNTGGGIYAQSGSVLLKDCTITDNKGYKGAGIYINSANVTLKNCTMTGNIVPEVGGAVFLNSNATLTLDGMTSIPGTFQNNDIGFVSTTKTISIGNDFNWTGNNGHILVTASNDLTVLVPADNSMDAVARAARHFSIHDASFSIGTEGDSIGKLVLNPIIYVSSVSSSPAGNDTTGDGSAANPYATFTKALTRVKSLSTSNSANYVIHVSGELQDSVILSTGSTDEATLGTFTNSTLTICGDNKATDKLKGSDAGGDNTKLLVVDCANKVTIQNLTLYGLTSNGYAALQINSESANVEVNNCDITGNTHTGLNTPGSGGGILNKGTLTLKNCSVTENKAVLGGGIYHSKGVVTIEDCTIQNNTSEGNGGGIFVNTNATLNVKGNITITGNKKGTGTNAPANNIHLTPDKVITVIGSITGSNIGVTTGTAPTATTPVTFTSGFGANCSGVDPNTVFTSDEEYMILTGTGANAGEAYLAASGGNINTTLDYNVTLSCANTQTAVVAPGSVIKVSAAVTKNGTDVSPAPTVSDITWSFTLLCGSDVIATIPSTTYPAATYITTGAGYASLTIPTDLQIYDGLPYTLHAVATYKDTPAKDADIALTGSTLGFVSVNGTTVEGAVSNSLVFVSGGSVTIPNMYASDHEVTQAEYEAVMGTNPSYFNGTSGREAASGEIQANRPVEKVCWYEAIIYCNERSIREGLTPCYSIDGKTNPGEWTGMPASENDTPWNVTWDNTAKGYRLPTDAEWEYLARGGSDLSTDKYAGTDSEDNIREYAWFQENSQDKTHEVKKKLPNSLGLYDMSGNVSEWCWDWNEQKNQRLDRGAHWNHPVNHQLYDRSIYSNYSNFPYLSFNDLGFRVVRTIQ